MKLVREKEQSKQVNYKARLINMADDKETTSPDITSGPQLDGQKHPGKHTILLDKSLPDQTLMSKQQSNGIAARGTMPPS